MSRIENSKVFVAGGRTGFIGANIAKALIPRCKEVVCHSLTNALQKPGHVGMSQENICVARLFSCDLTNSCMDMSGIDTVFHCAAATAGAKEIVNNQSSLVLPNLFMTVNLLDASANAGVKRFVFISSSVVYPDNDILNLGDSYKFVERWGDATYPLVPCYFGVGHMKRYCEKLAEFYHKEYGMEVLVIRPSQIYGPLQSFDLDRGHAIPTLIRKFVEATENNAQSVEVWGSPEVSRDYIYVKDFVDGVLKAFELFEKFDTFNIATGRNYTMQEVADTLKNLTGFKGDVVFNADKPMTAMKRYIDPTKAKDKLGFEAKTSLEEGLRRTIEWYRANR